MQKIIPCLWFDDQIEEAMNFYVSVFGDAKITSVTHYGDHGPLPKGTVLTATIEIEGQELMALNGGTRVPFTEAVSFVVRCETQAEVDYFWGALSEGGEENVCGWLKDKYGLSWQIVPNFLIRVIEDKDRAKADRVMTAMMGMRKIDIAALEKASAA